MQHDPSFDDGRPPYDSAFAAELLGKYVLVGVTINDRHGGLKRHEQWHGVVVSVDPREGFRLALRGTGQGTYRMLPPDTRGFCVADKGHYNLHSTGETVVDPDYLSTWTVEQQDA